jgi:hypothetical protein
MLPNTPPSFPQHFPPRFPGFFPQHSAGHFPTYFPALFPAQLRRSALIRSDPHKTHCPRSSGRNRPRRTGNLSFTRNPMKGEAVRWGTPIVTTLPTLPKETIVTIRE